MKKMKKKLLLKNNAIPRLTKNQWSILIVACMMLMVGQNVLAQDAQPEAGNAVKHNTKQIFDQSISLDVQSIPSGMYILKISNAEGKSISKKVIIQ